MGVALTVVFNTGMFMEAYQLLSIGPSIGVALTVVFNTGMVMEV